MKKTIALIGVVALSLGCWLATTPGDSQGDSASAVSPFKGRVIAVGVTGVKADSEHEAVLDNPRVERLGDRFFLVGTGVDYGNADDWATGHLAWIAGDEVVGILEFANVEEYKKLVGPARAAAQDSQN
jgi:hypothetical protein